MDNRVDLRVASGRRFLSPSLLALLLLLPIPTSSSAACERPSKPVSAAVVAPPKLIAAGWTLNRVLSPIQSLLNSRARMIQFAAIGMCIGLYILLRR
jgi:hypothetical protein